MNAESASASGLPSARALCVLALALALTVLSVTLLALFALLRGESQHFAQQHDARRAVLETRQWHSSLSASLSRVDTSLDQAQATLARLAELERERQNAAERAAKDQAARALAERQQWEAWQKTAEAARDTAHGEHLVTLAALRAIESASARAQAAPTVIVVQPQPQPVYWTLPVVWWPRWQSPAPPSHCPVPYPAPGNSQAMIPPGSSFRFLQTDNFDPFANGRRL